jgi:segregation and condensation protein B
MTATDDRPGLAAGGSDAAGERAAPADGPDAGERAAAADGGPDAGERAAPADGGLGAARPVAPERLPAALEALLMMATEPVGEAELAAALAVPEAAVAEAAAGLARFYEDTGRGFELRRVGGGWRYYTHPDLADVIGASILAGQHGRLTQAALETLAVIAYLQPISRSRVAAVRGVNVDGVVRTLLARDLVAEAGRDEATGAGLLATTGYFLERMGLASLDDLPPLAPNLPDAAALDAELANVVAAVVGQEERLAEPASEALVQEALVPEDLVSEALVPEDLVPDALVPEDLVSEALVSEVLVPEALVSEAPVPEALVPEAMVSEALVSERDHG